jgi:hypothetical protein
MHKKEGAPAGFWWHFPAVMGKLPVHKKNPDNGVLWRDRIIFFSLKDHEEISPI